MSKRKPPGEGSVTQHNGKWRVRIRTADGKRRSFGVHETREKAKDVRIGALALLAEQNMLATSAEKTLRAFGTEWLNQREVAGYRGVRTERQLFERFICTANFADWPLSNIRRRDVVAWLAVLAKTSSARNLGNALATSTLTGCRQLLQRCLAAACDQELISTNPARNVRTPRKAEPLKWRYVNLEEQQRLLAAAPLPHRHLLGFALGTGLRLGELYGLELRDVTLDGSQPNIIVRYGAPRRRPTKTGRVRRVPLFGFGLTCAREWLRQLPGYLRGPNTHGLMFPQRSGEPYSGRPRPPRSWPVWKERAGLEGLRWHDLRHSFASSLVAGWWGAKWSLHEVREVLGHTSIAMTQRYAHLAESVVSAVAQRTGTHLGHSDFPNPGESLTVASTYTPITHAETPYTLHRGTL